MDAPDLKTEIHQFGKSTYRLNSELAEADAEHLSFPADSFDIVYSWGVLHVSPDTPLAFREAYRVLRPGGTPRAMIYHRPSVVGLTLWARYGLAHGRPTRRLNDISAHHRESPGTKGRTVAEARGPLAPSPPARSARGHEVTGARRTGRLS